MPTRQALLSAHRRLVPFAVVGMLMFTVACSDDGTAEPSGQPAGGASPTSAAAPPSPSATAGIDGNDRTGTALRAITAAESQMPGGTVFDLEDENRGGQKVWSAKVATSDNRQCNLTISADGTTVLGNDEDTTPDDDIRKLRSATTDLRKAIAAAVARAPGKGTLTSVEIDTTRGSTGSTVVWEIEFGGDAGITVLVDAATGVVVAAGPDVG